LNAISQDSTAEAINSQMNSVMIVSMSQRKGFMEMSAKG
jgi:hypothetical protein